MNHRRPGQGAPNSCCCLVVLPTPLEQRVLVLSLSVSLCSVLIFPLFLSLPLRSISLSDGVLSLTNRMKSLEQDALKAQMVIAKSREGKKRGTLDQLAESPSPAPTPSPTPLEGTSVAVSYTLTQLSTYIHSLSLNVCVPNGTLFIPCILHYF